MGWPIVSHDRFRELSNEEVVKFIESYQWSYAKTMPKNPHFYVVRERVCGKDDALNELFNSVVMHIRQHGYKLKFGSTWYTCLDVGEYRYWTMGCPVDTTTIINRAKNPPPAAAKRIDKAPAMASAEIYGELV